MNEETPLLAQYQRLKNEHPGEVLFFRVGDFYEMFNDDAVEVSKLLNLTLTHRSVNPMCGVPFHAAKIYIARLLRLGRKVAIAEQIGEIAKGKGLTERKVIEIITPGTAVESEYLDGGVNNFLASAFITGNKAGFSYIDVTTGEFRATSFPVSSMAENLSKELGRCSPRELILPDSLRDNQSVSQCLSLLTNVSVSWYPDWNFNLENCRRRLLKQFCTASLRSFSLGDEAPEIPPAGFLLDYVEKTTNTLSPHIKSISVYSDCQYVIIDDSSRRNLEITNNLRDGSSKFTLLECLDNCRTAMGSRMLREWLVFPLKDIASIESRQNHIESFVKDNQFLRKIREKLDGILDVERLAARIAMDKAHAKDLQALRKSLELWLEARKELDGRNFSMTDTDSAKSIIDLIANSILDDPCTLLNEGGIIRAGWSEELDHWRDVRDNFNRILSGYLDEEKTATGIQGLKIRSNSNLGYYIEVSSGKLDKVPEHFILRRNLVNGARYTTQKLQELEESLNESGTKIIELEKQLFLEVRNGLKKYVPYLQCTSGEIAYADVASSFAEAAVMYNWVRPSLEENGCFDVKAGRHPVVERHLPGGEFVPNDLTLSTEDDSRTFALITGPNMAGKSTFLRQNALISLLAQTGSCVPASSARLGIVDRIFCRVGASDNLAKGESTFLVEMTETARILNSATEKSLVIMDEVGRGTSTEDGLSIAWAVSEYLLGRIKCKTLFATHYHELTRMSHPSLKNLCMSVSENGSDIVFLRKVADGSSENSYGIHVAKLAGLPETVIKRAEVILNKIQSDADGKPVLPQISGSGNEVESECCRSSEAASLSLFSDEEMVLDEILSADVDNMTPLAALSAVSRWKKSLSGR